MILPVETLIKALLIISVITNLTTEAIKSLLDGQGKQYSSNAIAAIVSAIATIVISALYLTIFKIPLDSGIVVTIFCLMWLSFLVATVGYDKVVKELKKFI